MSSSKEIGNGYALPKKTRINDKNFLTPAMMLTYSFRVNNPKPWLEIPNCSIMTNAYDILQNGRLEKEVREHGIHEKLGLISEVCAMDSGGFQFITKGEGEKIDPVAILDLQIASGVDIAVGLDYPILMNHTNEEAALFTNKSLQNIELAYKSIKNGTEVMPVLHGTSAKEIASYFNKVKKIGDFKIYGVGGLVPQMQQRNTSHKRYFNIIDRVFEARQQLNSLDDNILLHLFGVGSPLAGLLFLLAGADSIESISWIMNAKYFLVYQDKYGARKVSQKTTMVTTPVKWDEYECRCPICKDQDLKEIEQLMKISGNDGFRNRAMHNAFVYQRILYNARAAIRENRLMEFCEEQLGSHRFFKGILKYTKEKLQNCL
ncbi:MAG: tRNA-guanine transglycosylase [Asgard group archaeon]|nr:tRNA-guanine transglycosylase [Asgard group archaeon]